MNKDLKKIGEDLEWKLSCALNANDRQENYLLSKNKDEKSSKLRDTFFKLNNATYRVNKLISLYDNENNFFCKMPLEEIFTKEESFTSALTKYTQEQFSGGMASFATKKNRLNYSLHDLNRPYTFLLNGQDSHTKQECRTELDRQKTMYLNNKGNEIFHGTSVAKYKKGIEIAEKQLKALKNSSGSQLVGKDLAYFTQILEDDIKQMQKKEKIFYNSEILPILLELKSNCSAKIIQGNFDLKLLRQDYFLDKQNHVIKQLLAQHARHKLLDYLYKAERDFHNETYHLISSLEYMLKKEVNAMESRMASLNELSILSNYKAEHDLWDEFLSTNDVGRESVIKEKRSLLMNVSEEIDSTLKKCKNSFSTAEDGIKKRKMAFDKVDNELSKVSCRINEIVDYLSKKRDLVSCDLIESRKRRIFEDFFNEPTRLKKKIV